MISKLVAIAMLLIAAFYQLYVQELLFDIAGVGRVLQAIERFPYQCRRIQHEHLEGCEDIWLDNEARVLYLACSGSLSRTQWNPSVGKFNVSGRRLGGSVISALKIDEPGDDGLFGLRQMRTIGYEGAVGDGTLDTLGFDVEVMSDSRLRFWMVNYRPPVDQNKRYLDAVKLGANATVEVFELTRGSDLMIHVKTFADAAIATPNRVAATGDGGFVVTNDKSTKQFDMYLGGGNVAYCSSTECHVAANRGFAFPNGIVKGKDGLYYVPNVLVNKISVVKLQPERILKEIDLIRVGMPVDNLSVDRNGDSWAAAIPKPFEALSALANPYNLTFRSTIWRIHKSESGSGYEVKKMLEDKEAKIVGGATTVEHDVKTGRLFITGFLTPYIMICDPREVENSK